MQSSIRSEEQAHDEKFALMTKTPVNRLIVKLAIPTIITMLISSFYNMADTYFVGSLGTSATGGVGVAFSLMTLIQAVGFFFGHGAGNYVSRLLGAKKYDRATEMAATGFVSALVMGGIITVTGLIFLEPLSRLLGATDTIMPHAVSYIRYILLAAPWMACSLMLNNLLRFQGSTVYGMVGMVSGAVLNIVLDPILIHMAGMGVGGAGLATAISQFVSCLLLYIGCTRKGNIRISPRLASFKKENILQMFRGGTPSLFRQGAMSISMVLLNQMAGGFGDAAIAAISIVGRVTMLANSAMFGFGQGFQPVCGFNYGAERYDRVQKAYWFCIKVMTIFLTLAGIVCFILAPRIIMLFRADDPEVIEIGALALRFQMLAIPLQSWVICSSMMLQTIGRSFKASVLAFGKQGLFLLPALFILTPLLGILGIQLAQPVADFATGLLSIPLGISELRNMDKLMKQKEARARKDAAAAPAAEPQQPEDGAAATAPKGAAAHKQAL